MEEAAELGNYLPISFKTKSEQEYIAFLQNTNGAGQIIYKHLYDV